MAQASTHTLKNAYRQLNGIIIQQVKNIINMGLFNSFKEKVLNEFIDIIEWTDDSNDTMIWRFPRYQSEIKNGAQLTVRESNTNHPDEEKQRELPAAHMTIHAAPCFFAPLLPNRGDYSPKCQVALFAE